MKAEIRSLGKHLASLAWVAVRSFLGTLLVFTALGALLAGFSYYFLREHHWAYGTSAVTLVMIQSVVVGVLLGIKRAMASAATHGLGTLRLGRLAVSLSFDRMLGIAEGEEAGERGGHIARHLERLPLAQADELLSSAVRDFTGDKEQVGWLRRKIRARLLEAVRKYTLARFREEGSAHGGVDLLKVKEELEETVDDALIQKVRVGLRIWTAAMVIGLLLLVALQTWAIVALLPAKA